LCHAGVDTQKARVAILGLTFKEDCADLRNTRVVDIVDELRTYCIEPLVHDPLADPEKAREHYGIELCRWSDLNGVDAIIIAVAHQQYREMNVEDFKEHLSENGCLLDIKGILDPEAVRSNGLHFWRL